MGFASPFQLFNVLLHFCCRTGVYIVEVNDEGGFPGFVQTALHPYGFNFIGGLADACCVDEPELYAF